MWYLIAVVTGFVIGCLFSSLLSVSSPKESEKLIYENRILLGELETSKICFRDKIFELRQYLSIHRKDIEEKDGIITDLKKEIKALTTEKEFAKNHKRGFVKLDTEV
jgi:hypothetical protein